MTRIKNMTPEERHEQVDRLMKDIETGVERITTSDDWSQMLRNLGKFHRYSANNAFLIQLQDAHATYVASYGVWSSVFKRELIPGAGKHPIWVFGPNKRRVGSREIEDPKDPSKTKLQPIYALRGAPVPVKVYDVSQTQGPELLLPSSFVKPLEGRAPAYIWDAAVERAQQLGYTVEPKSLHGPRGATDPVAMKIYVEESLSSLHKLKTLLHETGHIEFGHVKDFGEYHKHRGPMEVEAESFAYIICDQAGIDTSDYSFGYVAGWSNGSTEVFKKVRDNIRNVASQFIKDFLEPLLEAGTIATELDETPELAAQDASVPKSASALSPGRPTMSF